LRLIISSLDSVGGSSDSARALTGYARRLNSTFVGSSESPNIDTFPFDFTVSSDEDEEAEEAGDCGMERLFLAKKYEFLKECKVYA
jgi:hypothetical protein